MIFFRKNKYVVIKELITHKKSFKQQVLNNKNCLRILYLIKKKERKENKLSMLLTVTVRSLRFRLQRRL